VHSPSRGAGVGAGVATNSTEPAGLAKSTSGAFLKLRWLGGGEGGVGGAATGAGG